MAAPAKGNIACPQFFLGCLAQNPGTYLQYLVSKFEFKLRTCKIILKSYKNKENTN
jgi:hypothetical protein